MNWHHLGIGKKLIGLGILGTVLPLLVVSLVAFRQSQAVESLGTTGCEQLSHAGQKHIVDGIIAMVTSQQEVLEQTVANSLNVAKEVITSSGGIKLEAGTTAWKAKNQLTGTEQAIDLPLVMAGDQAVRPNFDFKTPAPIVDKVKALIGQKCTIFQRMNEAGDMLRILTNIENQEGKRAIGTYIGANNPDGTANPVIRKVLQGERYLGRAFVVNAWYVTAYEPIKDAKGRVIGMIFVGMPEESATSLRDQIAKIKIGQTGYVYILDSKGKCLLSGLERQTGTSLWEAKDSNGRPFIQEIIQQGQALKPGQCAQVRYPWKNDGESQPRLKNALVAYFAPWDWFVCVSAYEEELLASARGIESANHQSMAFMAYAFAFCLAGSAGLWWFSARGISRPLKALANQLELSSGQTYSAAGQVAAASQSLAEGASEQASSLQETSASLEEMASMTQRNAEHAQTAEELARQARAAADSGAADIRRMNEAMAALQGSSVDIAKIIKTIDEIAFQTNILALNAAVEAARAGEAGMGFAVVAEEVRTLAQRSARAAQETSDKIANAIQNTQQGVEISAKVAARLQEIVGKARRVDELIAEVATASKEQSQGVVQINSAVSQMDKVTQANAASAEESASASEELNAQSLTLRDAVASLLGLVDGKASQPAIDLRAASPNNRCNHLPESKAASRATTPVKKAHRQAAPVEFADF